MRANKTKDKIVSLLETKGELKAQEIVKELKDIDRATIYRNLLLLEKQKQVRKIAGKGTAKIYELANETHLHMICEECGTVKHYQPSTVLLKELSNLASEFGVHDLELVLRGECKKTHQKNSPSKISEGV